MEYLFNRLLAEDVDIIVNTWLKAYLDSFFIYQLAYLCFSDRELSIIKLINN